MLILAVVAALGAMAFGVYLALLLRSIRKSAYGEGRLLDLPDLGVSLRYPEWWRNESLPAVPNVDRRPTEGGAAARLRTGHHRGLLTITAMPWTHFFPAGVASDSGRAPAPTEASQSEARALEACLRQVLKERGITLDETDVRVATAGPEGRPPLGVRAWVASGGSQASRPEERSYFELHLVLPVAGTATGADSSHTDTAEMEGMRGAGLRPPPVHILFVYTNSVLQGFLDAFYIEAMMRTLRFRTPRNPQ